LHEDGQAREVEAGGPGSIQEVMEADVPAPAEVALPTVGADGAAPQATTARSLVQIEVGRPGKRPGDEGEG